VEPARDEFKNGRLLTQAEEVKVSYSDGSHQTIVLPPARPEQSIAGPWEISFAERKGARSGVEFDRLSSWSEHADPAIRFYSGTAVYRTKFSSTDIVAGHVAVLDLGQVADIARVVVNSRDVGVWWKAPFRDDITRFLKPGENALEVHVANRWINRLIGDEAIASDLKYQKTGINKFTDGRLLESPAWLYDESRRAQRTRHSFSTWQHYQADSPLALSGLLGPVKLEWWHEVPTNVRATAVR
jgi:hypothetical protein